MRRFATICLFATTFALAGAQSPAPKNSETANLNRQIGQLCNAGKHSEAMPFATKLLELCEKTFGPDHPNTAGALKWVAVIDQHLGDYGKAESLYQRALKIEEGSFGQEHPDIATTLTDLAGVYITRADFAKAEPLLQRALKIREKKLGPERPLTALSLGNLANLYRFKEDYTQAEQLSQRALKITEKTLGPNNVGTASSLTTLALIYQAKGEYAKAEPLYQRALKIREKVLGPEHPVIAAMLSDLGELYTTMGKYAEAEPLFQRALRINEKVFGPEHLNTAGSLSNLGWLYRWTGSYAQAESFCERALKIREKILGPDSPVTAVSLNNLGWAYASEENDLKAEPLFQRALKINENAFGTEDLRTAVGLDNLGQTYTNLFEYDKAESFVQRALAIREKKLGPEHPQTGVSVINLGWLYFNLDQFDKAESLFQRGLKIDEKAYGPEHPETATSAGNLGLLYLVLGDYEKAEPLLQRALAIREKTFGPMHRTTANGLEHLASAYKGEGKYAAAEPLYRRAANIVEHVLGPDNLLTAHYLGQLGSLYAKMKDYKKAEPFYQRTLSITEKILGPEAPETAIRLNSLGWFYRRTGDYAKAEPLLQRALGITQKALGSEHPSTASCLEDVAWLDTQIGKVTEALVLETRARRAYEKVLSNVLSFTSEQQRLAFQKENPPYDLAGTLGAAGELAEIVLRHKGIVLDSLIEDQLVAEASADQKQREVLDRLRLAKQQLTKLQLEVPKDSSEVARKQRDLQKEKVSSEVAHLEGSLAQQVAGLGRARRALSVTVAQVQSALPREGVLIELVRYSHYLGKDNEEPRYGAIVITRALESQWVPLGSAAEIEKNVDLYQKSVRARTDEATLSSVLKTLNTEIWAPIEKSLPSATKTVIISPDGELSFVSFATLIGSDDKFVGEKYSVRYVASGRDLLREFKPANNSQANVYANPDFGGKTGSGHSNRDTVAALRSIEIRDLENISLPPLPGTEAEATALKSRFGTSANVFLGLNATKSQVQQVNSPHVVHLATHGFFLPEIKWSESQDPSQREEDIPKGKLINPMHRSGLALAGAETTLRAWGRGEAPPIENNGILTAAEVGGLKLNGTWLVVLSACDTGSGEARAGEGVMGLRRGFIQAGAQNLLMTLWPISDQTTVQIMLDFYDTAEKIHDAPQALADVQHDWLLKLRKERGLLDSVRLAGAFIMSSQGKQYEKTVTQPLPQTQPTQAPTAPPMSVASVPELSTVSAGPKSVADAVYEGTIHAKNDSSVNVPLLITIGSDLKSGTMTQSGRRGDVVVKFTGVWDGATLHAVTDELISEAKSIQWEPESFTLRFTEDGKRGSYECNSGGRIYSAELSPGVLSRSEVEALAIFAPKPDYPIEARRRHITGSGVCVVTIDPNGNVIDATMAPSIGNPILDSAAVSAFRRWRFRPGTNSKIKIPIDFTTAGASR